MARFRQKTGGSRQGGRTWAATCAVFVLLLATGCQQVTQLVDPLNVFGLNQPPVRVGVTTIELVPPLMLPKWEALRLSLSQHLQEPVQFELMNPHQIQVHLESGRLHFAMLRPGEFAEIASAENCEILAVPLNAHGQAYREGLIIAAPQSRFNSLGDARGKRIRFHFLPPGDLLNEAALGTMMQAGFKREEIDLGLLGLGLHTFHINSLEVAKSVVLEGQALGVIDRHEYDRWPEQGGSLVLLSPSKDQVRVIAQTVPVPEGAFVVSKQTDQALRRKVAEYLFELASKQDFLALTAIGVKAFGPPIDPAMYSPFGEVYRMLRPERSGIAATAPATEPATGPSDR